MKKIIIFIAILVVWLVIGFNVKAQTTPTTCNSTYIKILNDIANTSSGSIVAASNVRIFLNPIGGFFLTGLKKDSTTISYFDNNEVLAWTVKFKFKALPHQIFDMFVNSDGDLIGVANNSSNSGVIFKYNITTRSFVWIKSDPTYYTNINSYNGTNCIVTGSRGGNTHLLSIDKAIGSIINYSRDGQTGDFYSLIHNDKIYGACRRYLDPSNDFRASLFAYNAINGNFLWQNLLITQTISGTPPSKTRMYPVSPIIDNDSLLMLTSGDISGFNGVLNGPTAIALTKTDTFGLPKWTVRYNVAGTGFDRPLTTAIANTDSGYYLVGNFYDATLADFSYGFVIKVNKNGGVIWGKKLGIIYRNQINNVKEKNGFIYLAMSSKSYSTNNDLVLIKMDKDGNTDPSCHLISNIVVDTLNLPNISNNYGNATSDVTINLTSLNSIPDSLKVKDSTICIKCCPKTIKIVPVNNYNKYCFGDSVCFSTKINDSLNLHGAYKYTWYKIAGSSWVITNAKDTLPNPCLSPSALGSQKYRVIVSTNSELCKDTAEISVEIIARPIVNAGIDKTLCTGNSTTIGSASSGGLTYSWTSSPSGFTSTNSNPIVSPAATTSYYLAVTNQSCINYDTVLINVINCPPPCNCQTANCKIVGTAYKQLQTGIYVPFNCNEQLNLTCNNQYYFVGSVNCQSNCSGTLNAEILDATGAIIQSLINVSATNPLIVTFNKPGINTYTIVYHLIIGGGECSTCTTKITVNCPSTQCSTNCITALAGTNTASVNLNQAGGFTLANQTFTFTGLSTTLSHIRATVKNVTIYAVDENGIKNEECLTCFNNPAAWASIVNGRTLAGVIPKIFLVNGAVNAPATLTSLVQNNQNPRMISWTGTSPINATIGIYLGFLLPPASPLKCCTRKATICINFTFRDNECNECTVPVCFDVDIK